jgi:hypothetical protein
MGQVIFDETVKPLMRMTYQGLCDDAEWQRHLDVMSEWARRGEVYAVRIDRDRPYLEQNCAGGAMLFTNAVQQGLWTAISWVAPSPIPVKMFRDEPSAEAWLRGQLEKKMTP